MAIKEDEQEDTLKKAGHIFITKPVTTTEIISQIKFFIGDSALFYLLKNRALSLLNIKRKTWN